MHPVLPQAPLQTLGPLCGYLRALWNIAPKLHLDTSATLTAPFIAGDAVFLPDALHDTAPHDGSGATPFNRHAATAHAGAHLVYSPRSFDGEGLPPITRALLGLLEDARVEALACRELPGLRRLWAPLHTATPADGNGLETLMLRLARALLEPDYDDPHPWVNKGRDLFFVDQATQALALRQPADLRQAASRLGHDIGQMRLQFNARQYVPGPRYRDDHRWMWVEAGSLSPDGVEVQTTGGVTAPPANALAEPAAPEASAFTYPEWDWRIARARPHWCSVVEHDGSGASSAQDAPPSPALPTLARRLRQALLTQRAAVGDRGTRALDGEHVELEAWVQMRVAKRQGRPFDERLFRRLHPAPRRRGNVLLLIDQSASTEHTYGEAHDHRSVLQATVELALNTVFALQSVGLRCAVAGFNSDGRHRVQMQVVKCFDMPLTDADQAATRQLRSGYSTRLGAALRHGHHMLTERTGSAASRWLLLISDGQPHDIDVHDSRYLVEDARHAVSQNRRAGTDCAVLTLTSDGLPTARRIFGADHTVAVCHPGHLPRLARTLR